MNAATITSLMLGLCLSGCEGYQMPDFASWSANELDSGDTGDTAVTCADCGFDLEGTSWIYSGEIPGEAEAGIGCSEEDEGCQRCFLLEDGAVTISWRTGEEENWRTVAYGAYISVPGDEPAYRVEGRYDWLPRREQGLPAVNTGYVIVTDDQRFTNTTLAIGVCE